MEKVWYSYWGSDYEGDMPGYYPVEEIPELSCLAENFSEIRKEVFHLLETQKTHPYNISGLVEKDRWRVMGFYFWRMKNGKTLSQISVLKKCLDNIPNLMNASISILSPKTEIDLHSGDSNAFYRCHFGIDIPSELPNCGMEVMGVQQSWREGESFVFCDAQEHKAWNKTEKRRVILILDIIHPDYVRIKNKVATNILSGIWYQNLVTKAPFIKAFPSTLRGVVRKMLVVWILLYVPFQRLKNS